MIDTITKSFAWTNIQSWEFQQIFNNFTGFSTDSRTISPGELFIAIVGKQYDGHNFIPQAIKNGASGVLGQYLPPATTNISCPVYLVRDSLLAYGHLANLWRKKFSGPVVGITGSVGKTTVKSMLSSILKYANQDFCITAENFNNEIGVPQTIFNIKKHHDGAVIEMGARNMGDIQHLCNIAAPNISLVTNCAPSHLETFGSLENIAQEKGEIYKSLPANGIACVNVDEKFSRQWIDNLAKEQELISFSCNNQDATIKVMNLEQNHESYSFDLITPSGSVQIILHTLARSHVETAVAASAIAYALRVNLSAVQSGLANWRSSAGRLEIISKPHNNIILNDSYNASPKSTMAALKTLANYKATKVAILGDMLELGDCAQIEHAKIGQLAKTLGIEEFIGCGNLMFYAAKSFGAASKHYLTHAEISSYLREKKYQNTVFLIKGSRGMAMEKVIEGMMND